MSFAVKNTTFCSFLADIVCPHRCVGCGRLGKSLCECCKKDIILQHCNYCLNCKRLMQSQSCPYCYDYHKTLTFMVGWRDELVGKLVHDFKYDTNRSLGKELADILNDTLPRIDGKVEIVPLPTISRHIRTRGFDHVGLIAKKLAKLRGWQVASILQRAATTVQVGADNKTRIRQAEKAYSVRKKPIDRDATYLVLDDVWTTGASMRAATKKLREAGASKIVIAVLAVSRINN